MTEKYDSTQETQAHIDRVQDLLFDFAEKLNQRGEIHDASKLLSPEKEVLDEYTPKLRALTYGTPEYEESRLGMKAMTDHHYPNNSHHPEFYAPVESKDANMVRNRAAMLDDSDPLKPHLIEYAQSLESSINRMSLLDIVEMLFDHKAATERHDDGNIYKSIEVNKGRFGYSEQLKNIFISTCIELGWK